MGVDNLALAHIHFGQGGDFASDKFMQAADAYPGFFFMLVFVIITNFLKIVTVIKNANP
jgi:hypothetical protein